MTIEYKQGDRIKLSSNTQSKHNVLPYGAIKQDKTIEETKILVTAIDSTTNESKDIVIHLIN